MSDPSPLLAMRAGLITRFAADAALATLLGGSARLYDEPPRGAVPVYALFGDAEVRDDSVDGAGRHLHRHELTVIAKPGSTRSALEAAARMAALLAGTDMPLQGCRLVTIRVSALKASRDSRTGEARASLTVEAVTETF
ncbi:DUF3168 domain-containing protein [Methylobacterium sp. J-076]|uniref:tail completion protein gp17 n=1 Tax=Methylobacterium sp. J-076 TaxID=2836655 RepID=UPI001FBBD497|nr:DUF3168 domain-containing protein [Methylobacterium sp. J-076]MCJ2011227.1 DUF3168 domain-containing protein [Methylobacterium sp. J-076]